MKKIQNDFNLHFLLYNYNIKNLDSLIEEKEKSLDGMYDQWIYLEAKTQRICLIYMKLLVMVDFCKKHRKQLTKSQKQRFDEISQIEQGRTEYMEGVYSEIDENFLRKYPAHKISEEQFSELYDKYLNVVDEAYENCGDDVLKYCDELYEMFSPICNDDCDDDKV